MAELGGRRDHAAGRRRRATAGLRALENRDVRAGLRQLPSDAKAGNAGAYDDDVHMILPCAIQAAMYAPAATKRDTPAL